MSYRSFSPNYSIMYLLTTSLFNTLSIRLYQDTNEFIFNFLAVPTETIVDFLQPSYNLTISDLLFNVFKIYILISHRPSFIIN